MRVRRAQEPDLAALIDSHLHLSRSEFDGDREEVRRRAREAGVGAFLHVGFDPPSIEAALREAEGREDEWVSAGIHPHDAASWGEDTAQLLGDLARAGRIVAIGECGLDYFRDLSPRDAQDRAFRAQITLAKEHGLPMIFHVRDAYPDARRVLEDEGLPPKRGVFHAFAGDREFARWAVEAGFKLGIGGPLSYPKAHLREALEGLPPESFLLETDAPWLPPQPWRGKRNEPAYLRYIASRLAELCGVELDRLAETCARSFGELFGVDNSQGFNELRPSHCPEPPGRSR